MTQEQTMMAPFLHPHEMNWIRDRLNTLIGAFYFSGDYRVLRAAKSSLLESMLERFVGITPAQRALLEEAINVRDKDESKAYMEKLAPYVIPLPTITKEEIKKLFPKVKKLVYPDLESLDYTKLTFISWRDIATNTLYLVNRIDGKWGGTECKYVLGPKNHTLICKWCNHPRPGDQAALVTSRIKSKTLVDGYTTMGNHLCLNGQMCNDSLTSTEEMEAFLKSLKRF